MATPRKLWETNVGLRPATHIMSTFVCLAIVLFLDECHLRWGDVCGYGWGRSDMRVEIPMANERRRQTHFGALNDQTKEFILRE
jgi:hypothetical protein